MVAAGRTIYLAWDPPTSGAAVIGYDVLVTGSYIGTLTTSARTLSAAVTPGTYTIRVGSSSRDLPLRASIVR